VGVLDGVFVGVSLAVGVRVGVLDGVLVAVSVKVGVRVGVLLGVTVYVADGVLLGVREGFTVSVGSGLSSWGGDVSVAVVVFVGAVVRELVFEGTGVWLGGAGVNV